MQLTELLTDAGLDTLPTAEDLLAHAHVVSLPMWLTFRGVTHRELLLLEGPAGWGEFGAFPEYEDAEATRWLASGVEMAWLGPPPPRRHRIPINGTVPALNALTERAKVEKAVAGFAGVSTFKIKVAERGQQLADDIARVALVHELQPDARIRVDANAGWTVPEALHALPLIAEAAGGVAHFDYAEQPCATLAELRELRNQLPADIRIAADESVRRAADPLEVVRAGVVDQVVVKAAPLGGPRQVVRLTSEIPQAVTVSSALDSVVGMNAGIAAAAAVAGSVTTGSISPCEPGTGSISPCGLGTGTFFVRDVGAPHEIADGMLRVQMQQPDADALRELAASPERTAWWHERLRRCYALLGGASA